MTAIQMATINTAEHFGASRDVGLIAPGRYADILLVDHLTEMHIDTVIAKGQIVAEASVLRTKRPSFNYPDWATQSIHLPRPVTAEDFTLPAPDGKTVIANVIGVIENQAPTRHLRLEMTVENGQIHPNRDRDIAKIALVEHHKGT
jgi:adenine deaminase